MVVFLAYWQTLRMHVWQDDHAVMFKLQNVAESAGHFGTGIYDRSSSYRGVIALLYPIYLAFGTNTTAFYLAGLIAYFFAALSVYFLIKTISRNETVSYAGALIFTSGYIGAETLWRIFNSIHTSLTIAAICMAGVAYKKFIDGGKEVFGRKVIYYLASLILFIYAMETGFVRSHGIIFLIAGLELLWNFNFIGSLVRVSPFVYSYYLYYVAGSSSGYELKDLLNTIFVQQNFDLLFIPLRNLENIVLPSLWRVPLWVFVVGLILFFYRLRKIRKMLFYCIIFMLANYAVYFVHTPSQVFSSIHRYFSVPSVGSAFFIALILAELLRNQRNFYFAAGFVVITHIVMVNQEHSKFIRTITIPSKEFFAVIKREISEIPKGAIFYFDVKDNPESLSEFGNFFGVGSMPNTTAIAWQYGIDRNDLYLAATFEEAIGILDSKGNSDGNFYTFYYDSASGLVNTSSITKEGLSGDNKEVSISDAKNIDLVYTSPLKLGLNIKVEIDKGRVEFGKLRVSDLKKYLDYIRSKRSFYTQARTEVTSHWENQGAENLIDEDMETSWVGDRLAWHENRKEQVIVNLSATRNVGAVKLSHRYRNSTPARYTYSCSLDKENWLSLGEFFYTPLKETDFTKDVFTSTDCRFVKMEIEGTFGNDSPRISEIEIIESNFSNIDLNMAEEVENDPFSHLSSSQDLMDVLEFVNKEGITSKLCYFTNKSDKPYCYDFQLFIHSLQTYFFTIPPNGTILKSIEINVPGGVIYKVGRPSMSYLSYAELDPP